jgi:hypothetical protein
MKAARAIVTHETARGFVTNDTSLAHSFNSFINALSIWMHSQKNYPLLMRSLFSASALKGKRSGRRRVICELER